MEFLAKEGKNNGGHFFITIKELSNKEEWSFEHTDFGREKLDDSDGMVTWYYWGNNHNKLESKKPERCHIKII